MRTIDGYLDLAKARLNTSSDRAISRALNLSGSAVCLWRTKKTWPSDEQMVALARLAGIDPQRGLIDLNIWRSKSPEARSLYCQLAAQLGAAVIAALFICGMLAPHANAGGTNQLENFYPYTLCDNRRRRLRPLFRRLGGIFPASRLPSRA